MSTPHRVEISIDDQTLAVHEGGKCIRTFPVSTAVKGMGFAEGSHRTPTGRFRIAEKIGAGQPPGTIFKSRIPAGIWKPGDDTAGDLILTRVLRLDGLDAANANTSERFIYIHGTNDEDRLGQPASHGCIRMGNAAVAELFDLVGPGTAVEIHRATRRRGKLFFIDCDSTLSSIEGIDELARAAGGNVYERVVSLTHAAMNGDVPLGEVFARRMEMIAPSRETAEQVAELYIDTIVPGAEDFICELKAAGWLPVILSGGFEPLIRPLADRLGICHVEAVPLHFNGDGTYAGYGSDYPTTRNLGKNAIIREWKEAILPGRVLMMGDGASDLETRPEVDAFIGFGGVVARPKVQHGCDHWLADMAARSGIELLINSGS